jgi:hypothetical protein
MPMCVHEIKISTGKTQTVPYGHPELRNLTKHRIRYDLTRTQKQTPKNWAFEKILS